MDLTSIIKLLIRHAKLIAAVPVVLTLLVLVATRNQPREYSSEMSIYTGIASGVTIGSVEGNTRVDMFNTNNQFDNFINILKSKETNEEVALRLLALNLSLTESQHLYISKENYEKLHKEVPNDVKALVVKGDPNATFRKLEQHLNSSNNNYLSRLMLSTDPHYSLSALSKIGIKRIGNSDLVSISYQNNDPGITYQTLKILSEVFIPKYKSIKLSQTDAVVKYFERELAKVAAKLRNAEDRLLAYYKDNSVINYNEQTRYIAEQKEYLETEYVREKMSFASTKASASQLESKINIRDRLFLKNDSIVRLRNKLYNLNVRKAENLLNLRDSSTKSGKNKPANSVYQRQIDEAAEQLNNEVMQAMRLQNSVEGIAMEKILNSWLDYVVANEASRAKLDVMEKRFGEFRNIYQNLAPVGATIKRIEREIDINEQQYLSILHGLNMAKLKLQDVEMSSNIKLLDMPSYPLKPLPSSRKMMLIAAFMAGLLMVVATIILLEYIDTSIRTAERAAKLTHLKVLGILPKLLTGKPWLQDVTNRLASIISQEIANQANSKPLNVSILSTLEGDGKSYTIEALSNALAGKGYKVASQAIPEELHSSIENVYDDKDVVFYEHPPVLMAPAPAATLASMRLHILVVRANRDWNAADKRALAMLTETIGSKPLLILNGVDEDGLEHYIGELPKSRSLLRIWIKKVLSFNFFGRNHL